MVDLKTPEEISLMRKGGEILHKILLKLLDDARVGVRLKDLDQTAENLIFSAGGKPSFQMVPGYKWTICACVNDVVVHGIPDEYILQEGDLLGIDCGIYLDGFHTDHAWSKIVTNGKQSDYKEKTNFLDTGEKAFTEAIKQAQPGNYIYDISKAIQDNIEADGYSVVRSLVGHGVGRKLHEDPEVPGFTKGKRQSSLKIIPGMVLATEVIYNLGSADVVYKGNDGWTIATKDGKISGLFEATVAITSRGGFVLT
ncbi:type I methionyl aminopeptidase [Candidatus Gottesmanbacteria bacterium]|nr:type I methionyl aminopeptidase [Candidatus Gottesmanbacteria bacterium]